MKVSLTDKEKLQEFLLIFPKSKVDHLWMMTSFTNLKPRYVMDNLFSTGYGSYAETALAHFIDNDTDKARVEFQNIHEQVCIYVVKTLRQRILEGKNSEEYIFNKKEFEIIKQLLKTFKEKYINLIDCAHNAITKQKDKRHSRLEVSFDDKLGKLKINENFVEILKSRSPRQFEILSVIFSFYKDQLKNYSSIHSVEVANELNIQTRDIDNTLYQINFKLKLNKYPQLFDTRGKKIRFTENYELKLT